MPACLLVNARRADGRAFKVAESSSEVLHLVSHLTVCWKKIRAREIHALVPLLRWAFYFFI